MAFVAEDGTGKADANSLCALAFADAYFTDRFIAAWTGSDAVKQGALIRATDYIETRWSDKFRGVRQVTTDPAQALSFPRLGIGSDGAVPDGIKKACAEYALRALTQTLAPDPTADATGRAVKRSKKKVGPIETETEYAEGTAVRTFKPYPAADALVRPYLLYSGGVVRA